MKNIGLILLTFVITFILIRGCDSFTGTRAKSDDRSDDRVLRKQYDDLVLKNNDLNNTVKTQAKAIEDTKECQRSLIATITAKTARNNKDTVLIGKLTRQLINLQAAYDKLSKRSKIGKTRKKTRRITKKIRVKKAKKPDLRAKYIKNYNADIAKLRLFIKKAKRRLKLARDTIGKKSRISKINKIKSEVKQAYAKIEVLKKKIRRLQ